MGKQNFLLSYLAFTVILLSCGKGQLKEEKKVNEIASVKEAQRAMSPQSVPLYCEDLENPCADPACAKYYGCEPTGGERICGSQFAAYGLQYATFSEALNVAGQIHNDFQENILTQISSQGISLSDTNGLKSFIQIKTNAFLGTKGINTNNYSYIIKFSPGIQDISFSQGNYSSQAVAILNQLRSLIISYDSTNDASFFNSLNQLKQTALNLTNSNEVFTVGIPVSVAISSFTYWKNNAHRWLTIFDGQSTSANKRAKCRVGLGQLGAADVGGAISGGFSGVVLGPGGAFAGAVLTSSTASLGNLAGQVMGCLFSWW